MLLLLRVAFGALAAAVVAQLIGALAFDSWAAWWHQPTREGTSGSRVLVTGSSRGIGKAVALLYCELGAKVALHGRRRDALETVAAECRSRGASAAAVVVADMSSAGAGARAVRAAASALGDGHLDIVVVNHVSPYTFETQDSLVRRLADGSAEAAMRTDLYSYVEAAHAAVPLLGASGSLVLVTSLAAQMPLPYCYEYCYAKSALAAHAVALRQELAINGSALHVGLAHLGSIDTEAGQRLLGSLLTLPVPKASVEDTAKAIAAMSAGRINDLVIPGSLKPTILLGSLAPEYTAANIRKIVVPKK